jgi:hypothetical protein
MKSVGTSWRVLAVVVNVLGAAALADAQSLRQRPELVDIAERLTPPADDYVTVRLAIAPIADGPTEAAVNVNAAITQEIRNAFTARSDRRFRLIDPAEVDRAVRELQLGTPFGMGGALLVGQFVDADFVLIGALVPQTNGLPARLSLDLIDVERRRRLRTASADLAAAPPAMASRVPQPAPAPAPPPPVASAPAAAAPPQTPPQTTGTRLPGAIPAPASATTVGQAPKRRWIGPTGIGASIFAAFMTGTKERDLRLARARVLAVPPGAIEDWNRELDNAERIQTTRDAWRNVAIGAAAATAVYYLVNRGRDDRPRSRATIVPVLSIASPAAGAAVVTRF